MEVFDVLAPHIEKWNWNALKERMNGQTLKNVHIHPQVDLVLFDGFLLFFF